MIEFTLAAALLGIAAVVFLSAAVILTAVAVLAVKGLNLFICALNALTENENGK